MSKGHIIIDEARCKGCALCLSVCQQKLISLAQDQLNARGYHPAQFLDPKGGCTGCTLCAVICPDACITVYRSQKPVVRKTVRV
jgi:2-oxoglutarate ferredoxin oxidoreductase subunit delta